MAVKRVLAIVAHPDDEVLGCGATLALHAKQGDEVHAVIVCEGESLRYGAAGVGQADHIQMSARILGLTAVQQLGFRDQSLDQTSLTEIISPLETAIQTLNPQIIYTHHPGDLNRDHAQVFAAAMVAARPYESPIGSIFSMPVASSTEWSFPRSFVPDTWVDVSDTLDIKIQAMACYTSELRPFPHPRSLESITRQAKACGAQVCVEAAEAFLTVRRIYRHGKTPL